MISFVINKIKRKGPVLKYWWNTDINIRPHSFIFSIECIMISDQTPTKSVPNISTDRSFSSVVRSVCGALWYGTKLQQLFTQKKKLQQVLYQIALPTDHLLVCTVWSGQYVVHYDIGPNSSKFCTKLLYRQII